MIKVSAPEGYTAAPWQAEPYRLWSLLNMLRFYAENFVAAVTLLERARGTPVKEHRTQVFTNIVKHLQGLPVPVSLVNQAIRLRDGKPRPEARSLLIQNLQIDLIDELGQHVFILVPADDKTLILEPEKWFGEDAVSAFPDAKLDMREAGKCLALGRWNAAVFHAMGIMEHGLRALGTRVGVSLSSTIDLQNWHNIIEQIESQIKQWKQLPRAKQNQPEIEFCSRAASHFFVVKEAWRNHVSHARGRYDEEEARKVVGNVRDFMRVLA